MDLIKMRLKSTSSSVRRKARVIVDTSKAKEIVEAPKSPVARRSKRKVSNQS
jgi:hypothetical protein